MTIHASNKGSEKVLGKGSWEGASHGFYGANWEGFSEGRRV